MHILGVLRCQNVSPDHEKLFGLTIEGLHVDFSNEHENLSRLTISGPKVDYARKINLISIHCNDLLTSFWNLELIFDH